jgi:copper chaperone
MKKGNMFFGKKVQSKKTASAIFRIDGMHCTSCALNIDGNLEDIEGVISARTNYAKSKTQVEFDSVKISPAKLQEVIETVEKVGYRASLEE